MVAYDVIPLDRSSEAIVTDATNTNPAHNLVGAMLPDGWVVVRRLDRGDKLTGAMGSVGYVVENPQGEQAFLKALDLSLALRRTGSAGQMTSMLQFLTSAYNHERDLLRACRDQRMRRVVTAVSDGEVDIDPASPIGLVPYLVFEHADGDIRHHLDISEAFDTAWALRSLHHVATGLTQLHNAEIAHQDLKPSNVLVFGSTSSKIADLGSASARNRAGPLDEFTMVGDPAYAPPELLYSHVSPEWNARRFGCDAYLLGSMVVFFFARTGTTGLVLDHLDRSFWPTNLEGGEWTGDYLAVLPYVQEAFAKSLFAFRASAPVDFADDLVAIVRQLCEPDPLRRGHPRSRIAHGNPYSLERYVSLFSNLATRAEMRLGAPRA
jgi:eukaryotic-like serine/threonine-protein kinase